MLRAYSHSPRRSSHGSLVGSAAARNWNPRSLRSATSLQSCVASVPAAPVSPLKIISQQKLGQVWKPRATSRDEPTRADDALRASRQDSTSPLLQGPKLDEGASRRSGC